MNASVSHVEVAVQLRRVFGDFSCFGRLSCLIRINFKKASKSHFFHLWRRDPVLFGAGFGQEKKLLSCERHFIAAATCCWQIAWGWLRHSCSVLLLRRYLGAKGL